MRLMVPILPLLLFIIALTNATCQGKNKQSKFTEQKLMFEGRERSYLIHLPPAYQPGTSLPLVIALHGGGGTAAGMEKLTGLGAVSDREGFILCYPQGVGKNWNDGRIIQGAIAVKENINDVGFLLALMDKLINDYSVDRKGIYMTGISNGGFMSYRMALEAADRLAAIAPVAASLAENLLDMKPSRPISVLIINGDEDPLVPWEGGYIGFGGKKRGKCISAMETLHFWQTADGITPGTESVTNLPEKDPKDGTKIQLLSSANTQAGTEVILYDVQGGGHTWPGGWQYLGVWLVGRTSREVNASDLIWEFFKRHNLQ
jgi:polyhydroxybutyrate depolymerase